MPFLIARSILSLGQLNERALSIAYRSFRFVDGVSSAGLRGHVDRATKLAEQFATLGVDRVLASRDVRRVGMACHLEVCLHLLEETNPGASIDQLIVSS